MEKKKVNLYKLFSNISIFLTIGLVAILILMITQYIKVSETLLKLIFILLVLSISCTVSLTWIQKIMQNRYKKLSIVMLSVLGAFAILWITTIFVVSNFINTIGSYEAEIAAAKTVSFVTYLQVVLIASLQFILGSFIANAISNFGKSNLVLQVLNYLSAVMIDVWFCKLFTIFTFVDASIKLNDASFLASSGWWALFLIAAAILAITQGSITKMYKRRQHDIAQRSVSDNFEHLYDVTSDGKGDETKSATKKLEELKTLLDNNMITQEEYETKKRQILDEM